MALALNIRPRHKQDAEKRYVSGITEQRFDAKTGQLINIPHMPLQSQDVFDQPSDMNAHLDPTKYDRVYFQCLYEGQVIFTETTAFEKKIMSDAKRDEILKQEAKRTLEMMFRSENPDLYPTTLSSKDLWNCEDPSNYLAAIEQSTLAVNILPPPVAVPFVPQALQVK